jgi:hypothetical protein
VAPEFTIDAIQVGSNRLEDLGERE